MRSLRWSLLLSAVAAGASFAGPSRAASLPSYDHVFLIIEENHGLSQIIGNPAAPNLNALASEFGLATNSFSVADPSAPNYVAMLGGNYFGIADDNAYYTHTVDKGSLMSQLDKAGLSWTGYYQGLPYAGFRDTCYPARCNGVPDFDPLYSSKHNGVVYFQSIQDSPADFNRLVPIEQLAKDLQGNPPRFSYVIPDQCHDMHGSPPWCGDSGNPGDPNDNQLIGRGDAYAQELVDQITNAPFWPKGNNAIVITFDEGADGDNSGCCDAVPGTGRVTTIVITSHGPRHLQDATPYNHYSLLQTFQQIFRLGCLEFTCDTANVQPMARLFAISQQ